MLVILLRLLVQLYHCCVFLLSFGREKRQVAVFPDHMTTRQKKQSVLTTPLLCIGTSLHGPLPPLLSTPYALPYLNSCMWYALIYKTNLGKKKENFKIQPHSLSTPALRGYLGLGFPLVVICGLSFRSPIDTMVHPS